MPKLTNPDDAPQPAFVLAERYGTIQGPWHRHRRAQLIHASQGMLTVYSEAGMWQLPPQRAVWIPSNLRHRVSSEKGFWLRTLFIEPGAANSFVPTESCVVAIEPLVDQLLIAASQFGPHFETDSAASRLIAVLLDALPSLKPIDHHHSFLPLPKDPRLLKLTQKLQKSVRDNQDLAQLANQVGLTERTAARLFVKETGLSFGRWRQQLRLLNAVPLLQNGASVSHAAEEVGYADVSGFISVFKATFGQTPAKYFR